MAGYNSERKVLFHIGWPKTGTTTVQKHVFNKLEGYRYLGKVPFQANKNRFFFDLVHLVAYSGEEKFLAARDQVFRDMEQLEVDLFGKVDPTVPLILSEEAFLSVLLKPSDHQHHGYSTASLAGIVDRLGRLAKHWNMAFEFLISEREPTGLLHAYYAQMYNTFCKFRGLDTFQRYIAAGIADEPGRDLGFRYLRPGVVSQAFVDRFGQERVHCIAMSDLFSSGKVHLGRWYSGLPEVALDGSTVENQRSVSKGVKVAHLRPIWEKKQAFRPMEFLRTVKNMYRTRYAEHDDLEVMVTMEEADKESMMRFLEQAEG